jgi:hypothetical protein
MIAILTDPGIGGTFLTWSVYYLSGKTEYFSVRQNTVLAVPDSPLTHNNAHNFKVNQLGFTDKIDHLISSLVDQHPDECIYMHQSRTFDTQETIDQLCNNTKRIVAVTVAKEQILYFCRYNSRSDKSLAWTSNKMLYDNDDIFNDKLDHFFNKSKEKWHKENLTEVWDTREFIALNFNPFDVPDIGISHYINPQTSAFQLTAMDLWTNFDYSVKELFDYLDLHMYEDRYQKWLPIYNKWKQNHTSGIRFSWYFESIISNILKGIDFDLTRFELDIQQEAAIQHELIYKHNLNLKTWQLTKFTNTKQLHQLLEPNIHDLDKSLIKRLTT